MKGKCCQSKKKNISLEVNKSVRAIKEPPPSNTNVLKVKIASIFTILILQYTIFHPWGKFLIVYIGCQGNQIYDF